MSSPTAKVELHHHHCGECHEHSPAKKDRWVAIAKTICIVAIAVFAAWVNPVLFGAFAAVGFAIGVYNHFRGNKLTQHEGGAGGCSQGFIEHHTGVHMPAPLALTAGLALTLVHLEHHATVSVPIAALYVGAWVGQHVAHAGSLLWRSIRPLTPSPYQRA